MPSPNRLDWLDDELADLETNGLRRARSVRDGATSPEIVLDGQELIHFGSNDYLGLASDPRLIEAVQESMSGTSGGAGWGSGASALVAGRTTVHEQLEKRLAEFQNAEAAILFSSGYAANLGTIPALCGRGDAIFADAKNHASLIDGCRLSRADTHIYAHANVDALEEQLEQHAQSARRRLIVTDSLFSMDGDLAPLEAIGKLADRFDCMLMVDEAHATGVFGENGRGLCEAFGVADRVDIHVGTLSKALGGAGGFVSGRTELIEWLANRARSYVFSTAPPAAICAAAIYALDLVQSEPNRRVELLTRAADLRQRLTTLGYEVGNSQSQIIPLMIGAADQTMRLSKKLRKQGFFVPGIRPPTVPEGESLLRISLGHRHTPEMIDRLIAVLAKEI